MSRNLKSLSLGLAAIACTLPALAGTLSDSPLFLQSAVPPNVLFSLSVEFPTANTAAYQGTNDYSETNTYLGLFDPDKCYTYNGTNNWFSPAAQATSHACSGQWSGNFLNWASMTGLDEFRFAMTGGNRYVDTATQTVLQRTYQSGQGGTANFPQKTYQGATATPFAATIALTIDNQGLGTQMRVSDSGSAVADCTSPTLSAGTFSCNLATRTTPAETGTCTNWTGAGTQSNPYRCSTFSAFSGVFSLAGVPTGTAGTKSNAATTSTDTVTCANPSGTSNSNFNCTLTDTASNVGSCNTWSGSGTSSQPFYCSNFGAFGNSTFATTTRATASSYTQNATTSNNLIVNESSCSMSSSSPYTITCPLSSSTRTVTCIPDIGSGSNGQPRQCSANTTWTISGLGTPSYSSHTTSNNRRGATNARYYPPSQVTFNTQTTTTFYYTPSYSGTDTSNAFWYYSDYSLAFGNSALYQVRAEVCQPTPATGTSRETNCLKYGTSSYKPVGEVQRNGEKMRFGLFSYYNANDIDNAVMRSKAKYVAPLKWSSSGGSVTNTAAEWNAADGTLVTNPDPSSTQTSSVTYSKSGVINYVNQFGTTSQNYKTYDNVGKLYYETLKYLRGLQPTTAFNSRATASNSDGFPVITTWDDPVQYWCQKNYIIAMGDTHTHCDKRLPGGTSTSYGAGQCTGNSQTSDQGSLGGDSSINVATMTNALGTLEGYGNLANTFGFAGSASFYMSGLSYWAAKDGFRTITDSAGISHLLKAKTYVIDVQEYGDKGAPTSGWPGSQYWLAAKYGGVDTFDASGNPQNWSRTMPGYTGAWPQTLLPAGNPADMIAAVRGALSSIASQTGAGSAVGVSTGDLRTGNGTNLFSATYNTAGWYGDVRAYTLNSNLSISTAPTWSASKYLNPTTLNASGSGNWSNRRILTFHDGLTASGTADTDPLGRQGGDFQTSSSSGSLAFGTGFSARQQDLLDRDPGSSLIDNRGPDRVNYLAGDNSNEGATGYNWRSRSVPRSLTLLDGTALTTPEGSLGDFINSSPLYVRYPSATNVPAADYLTFKAYAAAVASRTPVLYAGGNDGMLHAFDASDLSDNGGTTLGATANSGKEVLAYVPAAVYSRLNQLTWTNYAHKYYVDGTPVAADAQLSSATCTPSADATKCWRTIVTGGLNAGGQGIYAMNVTDPSTFASGAAKSLVLWEFNDRDDADLGYSFVQPIVRKMNNGKWAVIFGNGYNNTDSDGSVSTTGDAYLYILYIDGPGYAGTGRGQSWTLGTNYHKIRLPAPNAGAAPLSPANGLSTVFGIDKDSDNVVDYLYAGDRYGNVWKIDVSNTNPANWGSAFSSGSTPLPLFTAVTSDTLPLREQITSSPIVTTHPNGGFMVMFGTGSFVDDSDNQTPFSGNSFYGIWDKDDGTRVTSRSDLQQQASLAKVTVGANVYGLQSDCVPQYSATPAAPTTATATCPTSLAPALTSGAVPQQLGWVLDLKNDPAVTGNNGERYISSVLPILEGGLLTFVTLTPSGDVCGGSAYDWTYNLDYLSGGAYSKPVFYDTSGTTATAVSATFSVTSGGNTTSVTKAPSGKQLSTALGQNPKRIYYDTDKGRADPSAGCNPFIKGRPCKKVKRACDIVTITGGCSSVTPPATGRLNWRQITQ